MQTASTETGTHNYMASRDRNTFDGEELINSSESEAQTQLGNPPLLLAVLLSVHEYLTENITHMTKVGHDLTVFSGSPLCQFTVAVAKASRLI